MERKTEVTDTNYGFLNQSTNDTQTNLNFLESLQNIELFAKYIVDLFFSVLKQTPTNMLDESSNDIDQFLFKTESDDKSTKIYPQKNSVDNVPQGNCKLSEEIILQLMQPHDMRTDPNRGATREIDKDAENVALQARFSTKNIVNVPGRVLKDGVYTNHVDCESNDPVDIFIFFVWRFLFQLIQSFDSLDILNDYTRAQFQGDVGNLLNIDVILEKVNMNVLTSRRMLMFEISVLALVNNFKDQIPSDHQQQFASTVRAHIKKCLNSCNTVVDKRKPENVPTSTAIF